MIPLRRKAVFQTSVRLLLILALLMAGQPQARAADAAQEEGPRWDLVLTGADAAHLQRYRGQNVRIGVIDSGINPHPDLADKLVRGHNYITDAVDPDDTSDAYGHGTRVAGLIAAAAPDAEIVPLKITNSGSVNVTQLCRAIYGGIDDFGCDVLNLSLGVPYERDSLREAIEYAAGKGVTVVAATGNDGTAELYYPAAYDSVIGVSAVDSAGAVSVRSNHNESVMIAAPGVDVRMTTHRGGYVTESGCSYAVPYVSAAAAILKGIDKSLTNEELLRILAETATDRGLEGFDEYYGYGILNIAGSVKAVLERNAASGAPTDPASTYADCPRNGTCPMARFSDLDRSAWYHDGIHYALDCGIMNGVSAKRFDPDAPTSRAMIVTILWRWAGEPAVNTRTAFTDVPADAWYTKAVRWAVSEGIAEGYSAGRFGPEQAVSREQLSVILYRYAKYRGADPKAARAGVLDRYTDASAVSGWAVSAVQWAVDVGLIGGVSADRLSPGSTAGRAQTATILMRYTQLFE